MLKFLQSNRCKSYLLLNLTFLFSISFYSVSGASIIKLVSVRSDGIQANDGSEQPTISADGRYIAFYSTATNLVDDDTNDRDDIFLHDQNTNQTIRVSVSHAGEQGNDHSNAPALSGDGRFVAFHSLASNLVTGDSNVGADVFVRDNVSGQIYLVSVSSTGEQGQTFENGQAFGSDSRFPSISGDGRFIAFESDADTLVTGDSNTSSKDIFLHDRSLSTTILVNTDSSGVQLLGENRYPSLSRDGRYVAFWSSLENDLYRKDLRSGQLTLVSSNVTCNDASSINYDGRFVAAVCSLPEYTTAQVVVFDIVSNTYVVASQSNEGTPANLGGYDPVISADGRFVAFTSYATNLVSPQVPSDNQPLSRSVYLRDVQTGITTKISLTAQNPAHASDQPAISANGKRIAYAAESPQTSDDLNGTLDVFLFTEQNTAPTVNQIMTPSDPQQIQTTISASATFSDPDENDSHMAIWNWGDGTTSAGTVAEANTRVTGSHMYTTAGVHEITLMVTDANGDTGRATYQYVVIYNPAAGFVSGSGTITSPPGAYAANPALTGKAIFGFISRYQNGASVPTGSTQFRFMVANFTFKSTAYDWLVVAGAKAQYKGTGEVNGIGNYGFLLTSIDGQQSGGGNTDTFRLKVWNKSTGNIVYDNQRGDNDNTNPTTQIDSGSIIIHP